MKKRIEKIIKDFSRSGYTKQTVDLFHRWLVKDVHTVEKDEALHGLWSETKGIPSMETDESFRSVLVRVGVETSSSVRSGRVPVWKYISYAAAVAVVSVACTLWLTGKYADDGLVAMKEYYAGNGERGEVVLPDGSTVCLNSGSHILYPEKVSGGQCTVYLLGEAGFKVARNPDRKFIVRSGDMSVTALGTEFNVKAYPEDKLLTATLLEGKVQVDCNDTTAYILSPGQQVIYAKETGTSTLTETDTHDVTAWQRGEIVIASSTFGEIINTLERCYGIHFHYQEDLWDDDRYNFVFKEDASVEDVLGVMQVVVGGFGYHLHGNICHIDKL